MMKWYKILPTLLFVLLATTSCHEFVFGNIRVSEEDNPLNHKKLPKTNADLYEPPVITAEIPNPDPDGAFSDWATCLIMIKEGHSHGGRKMHGNPVYSKAPFKQEQFAVVHNEKAGIRLEMDKKKNATDLEIEGGKPGPDYFRVIGGLSKMWGLCLYFFDKEGKLINDSILKHSDQYQIFFSISDLDDKGNPYEVLDIRLRDSVQANWKTEQPIPAKSFEGRKTLEARSEITPRLLQYAYRDTWTHEDMGDGAREMFNMKLLPPLKRQDFYEADWDDQDCVGLKGHLTFDKLSMDLDMKPWHQRNSKTGFLMTREGSLLAKFYLAVRVMKCEKGKKAVVKKEGDRGKSELICAPHNAPGPLSGWKEIIRFNLPIKYFTSVRDSDPTQADKNEAYYVHFGHEMGLTPEEAYEALSNIVIQGNGIGAGFGAWFL